MSIDMDHLLTTFMYIYVFIEPCSTNVKMFRFVPGWHCNAKLLNGYSTVDHEYADRNNFLVTLFCLFKFRQLKVLS